MTVDALTNAPQPRPNCGVTRAKPTALAWFGAALLGAAALTACSPEGSTVRPAPVGNDDGGGDEPEPPVNNFDFSGEQPVVGFNGQANAGTVSTYTGSFATITQTLQSTANEGIDQLATETLAQASDGAQPGIALLCNARNRSSTTFNAGEDRRLTPALDGAKGLHTVDSRGWIIVADFQGAAIRVFANAVGGAPEPLYSTGVGATSVWDIVYDPAADRLFAALTNGRVGVFDNFSAFNATAPSRTFRPSVDSGGSVNFHGIAHDAANDRIVVSDVGDAAINTDGAIVVFGNASQAQGPVTPLGVIRGPSTLLGNPVDITLDGTILRIAEKANDRLLAYGDIFSASGDQAPDVSVTATKPESLFTRAPTPSALPGDVSDIDTPVALSTIVVNQNPAAQRDTNILGLPIESITPADGSFSINLLSPTLSARGAFQSGEAADARYLENITFDLAGNAYASFDNGQDTATQPGTGVQLSGGLLVVHALQTRNGDSSDLSTRERIIAGTNTRLIQPKGVESVQSRGALIVADVSPDNANKISAFSTCINGNVAPRFATSDLGPDATAVWDIDYDPVADRLFAAATNGTILVYDDYFATSGAGAPDRIISLLDTSGAATGTNLHGIVAVGGDSLIVSDVGTASGADAATDGVLFTLQGDLATLDGDVMVRAEISGGNTQLGNPVDLAFDGANVFVAEKANNGGALLRFDNVLALQGLQNIAPTASLDQTNPESVALAPSSLGGR